MAELRRLARLARIARDAGGRRALTMHSFAAIPDLDSDTAPTNRARIIYRLDEQFGLPDELAALAASFQQPTVDPEAEDKRKAQARQAAEDLTRRLKAPDGGIL